METVYRRNVSLYPWYQALYNAHFWLPVFFLFFNSKLAVHQVLLLETVYYIVVVALEVPSGYFSDTLGRRKTLVLAAAALIAAHSAFLLGNSFELLACGQVCLAVSMAFNSGTDASLHFESLSALGRENEYGEREAAAGRRAFLAGAGAAMAGGIAGCLSLNLPYALSLGAAILTVAIALSFTEPPIKRNGALSGAGFVRQLAGCVGSLRVPRLRWLFVFSVAMIVMNHIPYEFYQPYVSLSTHTVGFPQTTPLLTGLHAAAAMLVASWGSKWSMRLSDRIGVLPTLLTATALQTGIIVAMALLLHPVVVGLLVLRSVPRGLMTAPLNAAIAPCIADERRATYFSLQSLAGRLGFAGLLTLLALVLGKTQPADWGSLSSALRICALYASVAMAVLMVWAHALRRQEATRTERSKVSRAGTDAGSVVEN